MVARRSRRTRADVLAAEEPLEIRIVPAEAAHGVTLDAAAVPVSVTMRTPGADFELAAGFLFGEGLIGGGDAISAIRYCTGGEQQYNVVHVVLAPGDAVRSGVAAAQLLPDVELRRVRQGVDRAR